MHRPGIRDAGSYAGAEYDRPTLAFAARVERTGRDGAGINAPTEAGDQNADTCSTRALTMANRGASLHGDELLDLLFVGQADDIVDEPRCRCSYNFAQ